MIIIDLMFMFAIFNDETKQSQTAITSFRYYDSYLLSITL